MVIKIQTCLLSVQITLKCIIYSRGLGWGVSCSGNYTHTQTSTSTFSNMSEVYLRENFRPPQVSATVISRAPTLFPGLFPWLGGGARTRPWERGCPSTWENGVSFRNISSDKSDNGTRGNFCTRPRHFKWDIEQLGYIYSTWTYCVWNDHASFGINLW